MKEASRQRIEIPPFTEYIDLLDATPQAVNMDNFHDFMQAERQEHHLFRIAALAGPRYMVAYANWKKNPIGSAVYAATSKMYSEVSRDAAYRVTIALQTGDVEFDAFRQKLQEMDWTYNYSDDIRAWRSGKTQLKALEAIVKEKGGIYQTAFDFARDVSNGAIKLDERGYRVGT